MSRPWFQHPVAFLYGLLAYLLAIRTMVYLIGFVSGIVVPIDIDSGAVGPPWQSAFIDLGLMSLFALVHSLMARPVVKRWLARFLPPQLEPSTYALVSSLLLLLVFWGWQPLVTPIWSIAYEPARIALFAIAAIGWLAAMASTHTLGHFDLFGLRQAWRYGRGKPYEAKGLSRRWLYGRLRHPVYLGFLVGCWATPEMSLGRLLFAGVLTVYVGAGIAFEERDLLRRWGSEYQRYQDDVPRLVPRLGRRKISPS